MSGALFVAIERAMGIGPYQSPAPFITRIVINGREVPATWSVTRDLFGAVRAATVTVVP